MIRPATLADVPLIVEIGRVLHDESPAWRRLSYSPERVALTIEAMIKVDTGLVLVAVVDGVIIGGIACIVMPHWSSDDYVAQEISFFILPEHRGNGIAPRLVTTMRAWAYEHGAVLLLAGTSTGVEQERCARMYEKLGFTRSVIGLEVFFGRGE